MYNFVRGTVLCKAFPLQNGKMNENEEFSLAIILIFIRILNVLV